MSGANPNAGPGQAPAAGDPNQGQAPQANNGGTASSAAPMSGQAPAGNSAPTSAADYDRMIAELRRENATHRTKLKQIEDAQAAADLAKLGDLEKAQKQLADAQKAADAYKQRVATYAVQVEAQKLGIVDPELAALAIASKLEFEDDGTPKNAQKLLSDLIVAKPWLVATPAQPGAQPGQPGQQPQRPPVTSGGPTAPGAGAARPGVITKAAYAAMSPAEKLARNKDVLETLRQNGGRLPD